MQSDSRRIIITMGDPCGVGPEIIVKALAVDCNKDTKFLVIGNRYYFDNAQKITGCSVEYSVVDKPEFTAHVSFYQPLEWNGRYQLVGEYSVETGRQSYEYVRRAVGLCLEGFADAVVTAPICKAAWKLAGVDYPGHTELIGEICGEHNEVMLLAGGGLRVGLVTIHEAIAKLPQLITQDKIIRTVRIINADFKKRFGLSKPRFAVLGLNPHAGEKGHIGREEVDIINPALKKLVDEGIDVSGALPADTAFHRMLEGEFDVILAMFHDQGLAPLKTVAFDSGVNLTLGLPVIRSSVDHGTAFDLAGTGRANSLSLCEAIKYAVMMSRNQQEFLGCL